MKDTQAEELRGQIVRLGISEVYVRVFRGGNLLSKDLLVRLDVNAYRKIAEQNGGGDPLRGLPGFEKVEGPVWFETCVGYQFRPRA